MRDEKWKTKKQNLLFLETPKRLLKILTHREIKIKKLLFLNSLQRILIPTGLKISLPETFEGQIRPRSGLALKHGVTVLNSPGTIDADYKGEVGVILINLSDKMYEIKPGDRIAQMIISNFSNVNWKLVEDIGRSKRGSSGFGSSGSN